MLTEALRARVAWAPVRAHYDLCDTISWREADGTRYRGRIVELWRDDMGDVCYTVRTRDGALHGPVGHETDRPRRVRRAVRETERR